MKFASLLREVPCILGDSVVRLHGDALWGRSSIGQYEQPVLTGRHGGSSPPVPTNFHGHEAQWRAAGRYSQTEAGSIPAVLSDDGDIRCPFCQEMVAVRDAPAHLNECRKRVRSPDERF